MEEYNCLNCTKFQETIEVIREEKRELARKKATIIIKTITMTLAVESLIINTILLLKK